MIRTTPVTKFAFESVVERSITAPVIGVRGCMIIKKIPKRISMRPVCFSICFFIGWLGVWDI